MRTGSSDMRSVGRRGRSCVRTGSEERKTRDRGIGLEGLEWRTLLATIPAPAPTVVNGTRRTCRPDGLFDRSTSGNANSPTVVVDPYDSQKIVAVWSVNLARGSPGAESDDGHCRGRLL